MRSRQNPTRLIQLCSLQVFLSSWAWLILYGVEAEGRLGPRYLKFGFSVYQIFNNHEIWLLQIPYHIKIIIVLDLKNTRFIDIDWEITVAQLDMLSWGLEFIYFVIISQMGVFHIRPLKLSRVDETFFDTLKIIISEFYFLTLSWPKKSKWNEKGLQFIQSHYR